MAKTSEEVQQLKRDWEADPCWDIETTEGFEDYHKELEIYRRGIEAEWKENRLVMLKKKSEQIGCPGNIKLAEYVLNLEWQIEQLYQRIANLP
jgi:hypothetical protein